jgi:hypothetical protein
LAREGQGMPEHVQLVQRLIGLLGAAVVAPLHAEQRQPSRAFERRATACVGSVRSSEVILVLHHNGERLQRRNLRDRRLVIGLELRVADVADVSQVRLGVAEIMEVE